METVDLARTMLKNVIDPELGLNIVDLGLIYDLKIEDNKAFLLITFTTMGCPIAGHITNGIYEALEPLGLEDIKIEITYDPPWNPSRMTPEGKQLLGMR